MQTVKALVRRCAFWRDAGDKQCTPRTVHDQFELAGRSGLSLHSLLTEYSAEQLWELIKTPNDERRLAGYLIWLATRDLLRRFEERIPGSVTRLLRSTESVAHVALLQAHNLDLLLYLVERRRIDVASALDRHGRNLLLAGMNQLCDRYGHIKTYDLALLCFLLGVPLDARDKQGQTALHAAVAKDNLQTVALLLRLGANPRLTNHLGETAAQLALKLGHLESNQVLVEAGAGGQPATCYQRFSSSASRCRRSWWYLLFIGRYWIGLLILSTIFTVSTFGLIPMYLAIYYPMTAEHHTLHLLLVTAIVSAYFYAYTTFTGNRIDTESTRQDRDQYQRCMEAMIAAGRSPSWTRRKRNLVLAMHQLWSEHYRLCHLCQRAMGPNSKHCYYCRRCVDQYDHHCVFLLSCIHRNNCGNFIALNVSLVLIGLLGLRLSLLVTELLDPAFKSHPLLSWYRWLDLVAEQGSLPLYSVLACLMFQVLGLVLGPFSLFQAVRLKRASRRMGGAH